MSLVVGGTEMMLRHQLLASTGCTVFYDVQNYVSGDYIPGYQGSNKSLWRKYGDWNVTDGHGVFDGNQDWLDPHNPVEIPAGRQNTLMVFFNTDTTSGNQAIAGNLRSPDYWNEYGQGILMNGSTIYAMCEENDSNDLVSGGTINTGTWYFACAQFHTASGGIYVGDGGSLSQYVGDLSGGGYAYKFRIGGSRSSTAQGGTHESGNWFDGKIDIVIGWDRILTEEEVRNLYRFYGQRYYSGETWDAV